MFVTSLRSVYGPASQVLKSNLGCSKKIISACIGPRGVRHYLSPAYSCQEQWSSRLKDEYIKDVKPTDYYYDLLRKYKKDGKVSSIDADIFLNSITNKDVDTLTDEMEEVLRLLRRSRETRHTLASTPHAVVRCFLEAKKYDLIIRFITDPMNYGVFLDPYTANLLMDAFLKEDNIMAAARVAFSLTLQEDFGPPLTRGLVLLSCLRHAFNPGENEPWEDYTAVVEPEEEVKVVVRYIRNPSFDDHFDLRDPALVVGKTLAWVSYHMEEEDVLLRTNARVLGWSLYQKWGELEGALGEACTAGVQLGEEVLLQVSAGLESCSDEKNKSRLEDLVSKIREKDLVWKQDFVLKAEEAVKELALKYEKETVEEQAKTYSDWVSCRSAAVASQFAALERRALLTEIEVKKEDLSRREDVIFFFDNKNKFDLLTPRRVKYYPKKRSLLYHKKKPRVVDREYVPPEV